MAEQTNYGEKASSYAFSVTRQMWLSCYWSFAHCQTQYVAGRLWPFSLRTPFLLALFFQEQVIDG